MNGTENAVARRGASAPGRGETPSPICARQATGGDVKIRFDKVGYPLYCDAGPYEGDMRIDLNIRLYLSPEEYARYEGSESLQITLQENGDGRPGTGNTAEPSGQLSDGDAAPTPCPQRPGAGQRPANPQSIPRKEPNRP